MNNDDFIVNDITMSTNVYISAWYFLFYIFNSTPEVWTNVLFGVRSWLELKTDKFWKYSIEIERTKQFPKKTRVEPIKKSGEYFICSFLEKCFGFWIICDGSSVLRWNDLQNEPNRTEIQRKINKRKLTKFVRFIYTSVLHAIVILTIHLYCNTLIFSSIHSFLPK